MKNSISTSNFLGPLFLFFIGLNVCAQNKETFIVKNLVGKTTVLFTEKINNINHPQVAYWFITEDLLENEKYLSDLDSIAAAGIFDLVFLTAREGVSFHDTEKMHPVFQKLVKRAHEKGMKIGLQLWQDSRNTEGLEDVDAFVSEKETVLDEDGNAKVVLATYNIRAGGSTQSELLRAVAFKKTGEGFYQKGTMTGINSLCSSETSQDSVVVKIKAGKKLAGYHVFLSGVHYVKNGDLFGNYFINSYKSVLDNYKDIPFDATGLDEFKATTIKRPFELKDGIFHEKKYSLSFARLYKEKYGRDLESEFFRMRYAPDGNEEERIRSINQYMDEIRNATTKVETFFYNYSKQLYGSATFSGLHNTFHRSTDELWQTGKNYWNIPREYGHTDEMETKPVQLGVLYSHPKNMMYNMFYDKDTSLFLRKACEDLAYNIRTHYHAINDHAHGWGVSVETPIFQERLTPIERKARLLNQFNPAPPQTDLLIVFGFEAVLNWYPAITNRDAYDLNDRSTKTFEKADSVWKAGFVNALLPADQIENGKLTLNANNEIVYNGHKFKSMIFLYPQFSKEATLKFLEKFVKAGGKLMIEGPCNYDFNGKNISERFQGILKNTKVVGFDIKRIPELGIKPRNLSNGTLMEDGSWVMSDFKSLGKNEYAHFQFEVDGDRYEGDFKGVVALKASRLKGIEKFTCGGFKQLSKNGTPILQLDGEADVLLKRNSDKGYELTAVKNNKPKN